MSSPAEAAPYQNQRYDAIQAQHIEYGNLFEDRIFPAEDQSAFFHGAPPFEIKWLRPSVRIQIL